MSLEMTMDTKFLSGSLRAVSSEYVSAQQKRQT